MFCTKPNTGTSTFRNISAPFRASNNATSWGVDTITAPEKNISGAALSIFLSQVYLDSKNGGRSFSLHVYFSIGRIQIFIFVFKIQQNFSKNLILLLSKTCLKLTINWNILRQRELNITCTGGHINNKIIQGTPCYLQLIILCVIRQVYTTSAI